MGYPSFEIVGDRTTQLGGRVFHWSHPQATLYAAPAAVNGVLQAGLYRGEPESSY